MGYPKLSIVLPSYNDNKYISHCVDSILNQTFVDFELIIIDGGSSDGTLPILENYEDSRMHIIKNSQRRGRSAARNQGLQKAQGDYIIFHDADDVSREDRFLKQLRTFDNKDSQLLVGSTTQIIDKNGSFVPCKKRTPPANIDINYIWKNGQPAHHAACMFKTDVIKNLGGYRVEFRRGEDLDLWYRLIEKYDSRNMSFIDEPLYYYRIYPGNSGHVLYHKYAYNAAKLRKMGQSDEPMLQNLFYSNLSTENRTNQHKLHSYHLRLGTHSAEAGATILSLNHLFKSIQLEPWLIKPYLIMIYNFAPSLIRPVLSQMYHYIRDE